MPLETEMGRETMMKTDKKYLIIFPPETVNNSKSRWNGRTNSCEYENSSWCNLPKFKRCERCMRCTDESKACGMMV